MLASIRRFTKTWPAKALFAVLVIAFGFWGVSSSLNTITNDTAVARVDGTRIEVAQAQRAYQQQLAQLTKQLGANASPSAAQRLQVASQAVQQLAVQTALTNALKRLGIAASDPAIREATYAIPAFAGPNGGFDRTTFLAALRRNNMDEPTFIGLVRADVTQRQLVDALDAGIAPSQLLVDQLFAYSRETRLAVAAHLPSAGATAPQPTEPQLRRFYANNPALYATPEYRRIKAVILSPETLARDMPVTEAEIAAAYKATLATYQKPERRSVQIVSAPDQATATRLAAAWQAGADWAAIQAAAKQAGATALELNAAKRAEMPDAALGTAAFAAAPQTISQPVRGDFGWYVVRVTDIMPATDTTLAQVHDDLRLKIGALKAADGIDDRANKLEDALAGGGGLDTLPAGLGVAAVTGTLDARGLTPEGTPAPLPASADLRAALIAAAFAARPGEAAHLAQLPPTRDNAAGAYYAVTVETITKPSRLSYDQVAARVLQDWTLQQQRHAAETKAAAIAAAVQAGASLGAAATAQGVTTATLPPVPRPSQKSAPPEGVPDAIAQALFTMPQGATQMVEVPDGFWVVQLQTIAAPSAAADPVGAGQLRASLKSALATDTENTYIDALRARSRITYNDRLIQGLAQSANPGS